MQDFLIKLKFAVPALSPGSTNLVASNDFVLCMSTFANSASDAVSEAIRWLAEMDNNPELTSRISVHPGQKPWVVQKALASRAALSDSYTTPTGA